MKKLLTVLLLLIMAVSLLGCSSGESKTPAGQAAASASSAQESQAKDTPAPSSKPAKSKKDPVPLVEDFPQDAPQPKGVICEFKKLDIKDRDGNYTWKHLYRVNIDTNMASVIEVYDHYKGLFTKITRGRKG